MTGNYSKTYDQALKYVALRNHTTFELRAKLLKKKFDKSDIDAAIFELVNKKYVNDHDFAMMFAQNLIKYKSFGYYGVKNKLKQRGISDAMCEEVLSEEFTPEAELKIAQRLVNKTRGKDKTKVMMSLQRKGFRMPAITKAVGKMVNNSETDQENFEE